MEVVVTQTRETRNACRLLTHVVPIVGVPVYSVPAEGWGGNYRRRGEWDPTGLYWPCGPGTTPPSEP